MKKERKTRTVAKIVAVPMFPAEIDRLLACKPQHVRATGAWARQLIVERVAQLEQSAQSARSGR